MTGYQKLKKENEILWRELESWLFEIAKNWTDDKDDQKQRVEKEKAYIKWRIKDETN